jgi:hypothetical protein
MRVERHFLLQDLSKVGRSHVCSDERTDAAAALDNRRNRSLPVEPAFRWPLVRLLIARLAAYVSLIAFDDAAIWAVRCLLPPVSNPTPGEDSTQTRPTLSGSRES